MTKLSQIKQACKSNNHELIKHLLDSAESNELKRQVFLKVIHYYEQEEGLFPVGYSILFIEWLLNNKDFDTARDYIVKLNRLDITNERISELIFEYIIKANESDYRKRFNENLELLKKNKIIFSREEFNFEHVKQNVLTIANYQDKYSVVERKSILFLSDAINFDEIQRLLVEDHSIYLIYDDLKKFYYILLFEDLSKLSQYIEQKKIIFLLVKLVKIDICWKIFSHPCLFHSLIIM